MDNLVFEESITTETDQSEFIEKKWVYVNDNNAQNYSSQVVIDSTPLSNAGGLFFSIAQSKSAFSASADV